MRVSNNIHNVACLDEVEFCQMWTEEEKIPVKTMPPQQAQSKPAEEKKEGTPTAPAEGEQQPPAENGEVPTVPEPPKPEPVQEQ